MVTKPTKAYIRYSYMFICISWLTKFGSSFCWKLSSQHMLYTGLFYLFSVSLVFMLCDCYQFHLQKKICVCCYFIMWQLCIMLRDCFGQSRTCISKIFIIINYISLFQCHIYALLITQVLVLGKNFLAVCLSLEISCIRL